MVIRQAGRMDCSKHKFPNPDVVNYPFDVVSNDTIIMHADKFQGLWAKGLWAAQTDLLFDVVKESFDVIMNFWCAYSLHICQTV